TNANNINELYPIRVGLSIVIELNDVQFYLKIIEGNKNNAYLPGYLCQANDKSSDIEETTSAALTNLYQQIFSTKTKFSGLREFGLDNQSIILEHLLEGVNFRPFFVYFDKFQIFVYNIESSSQDGYEVFKEFYEKEVFKGKTPNDVWNKIGLFPMFDGKNLFGLIDLRTQQIIKKKFRLACQPKDWIEESNLEPLYLHFLKHHTRTNIQWYKCEFWTRAENWKKDLETMQMLHEKRLLYVNLTSKKSELCVSNSCEQTKKLATTIAKAIDNNKKEVNGKRRILSIIAEDYSLKQLKTLNALREKQKFGKKGGDKRILKEVVELLKGYFHSGNTPGKSHLSAEDMMRELHMAAEMGHLAKEKILQKVDTIRGWISRYSAYIKAEAAEKVLTTSGNFQ
ncbi:5467_t:CDS:2, partial [Funneliformis caledonium]